MYLAKSRLAQNVHNIIIAEENSELHIITGCATSVKDEPALHLGISEFYVKKGAKITFTMIHSWTPDIAVRPRSGIIVEEGGLFLSNYVVMKLWRDSFAPNLLAVDGPDRPLNFVATRSADKQTVFLKVVNPTSTTVKAAVRFDGDLVPRTATMQLVAPGGETVKNSLEKPDNIRAVTATAFVKDRTITFAMPPLSAGVVRVAP